MAMSMRLCQFQFINQGYGRGATQSRLGPTQYLGFRLNLADDSDPERSIASLRSRNPYL